MFIDFFDWFCSCLVSIFDTMKKFTLFDGFSYFNFVIALLAVSIIFKLIKFIMMIEDEEVYYHYTNKYSSAYDYKSKHASKKRGWFR